MTNAVTFGAAPGAAPAPAPQPGAAPAPAPQPGATPPQPGASGTPEVPAKFKNADGSVNLAALVSSYGELERQFSARPAPQPGNGLPPQPGVAIPGADGAQPASQRLDMSAIAQDYQQNGGALSDRAYAYAAARGVDRGTLDSIVAGQKALGEQRQKHVFDEAGGEQNFRTMQQWAGANFSSEEKVAFTRIMQQGGKAEVKMVIDALKARYIAANGNGGQPLEGRNNSAGAGFASAAEMSTAMRDPRYKTDPAYRQEVANKVATMAGAQTFRR